MIIPDYKPRNDFVLVRIVKVDTNRAGLAMPEVSLQGKEFHVVAIGPKVEGLCIGDKVMMIGKLGEDYAPLPHHNDLIVLKEANIILITGHTIEYDPPQDLKKQRANEHLMKEKDIFWEPGDVI